MVNIDYAFFVLVPVYKAENYISNAIESVLNQTFTSLKLILVDDGSPDKSGMICDEYALKDSRITVIHQKNNGALASRDTAINYIQSNFDLKGSYVVFMDSDDSLKPEALETIYGIFSSEKCDMVVYGMDRVVDGLIVKEYNSSSDSYLETNKRVIYKKMFMDPDYNTVWRKAIKAELLPTRRYNDYYDIKLGEDLLSSIDYYKAVSSIYYLENSLYNYTVNPNSLTMSVSGDNYVVDFTVRENVFSFLKEEDVFTDQDWDEYIDFCVHSINGLLYTVSNFTISICKRIRLIKEIAESDYYKKFLKNHNYKRINNCLYYLFDNNLYFFVIIVGVMLKYVLFIVKKLIYGV